MEPNTEKRSKSISRRGFIKGAAVSTTGVIAAATIPYSGVRFAGAADSKDNDEASKSWKTPPESISDRQIDKTIKVDVLVLGAGIAGTAAARSAAETGASVAVLEKLKEERYAFYGGEMGSVNSKFVLNAGGNRIDEEEFIEEWQRRTGNRTDPNLVKQYAYHSGDTFDWFTEVLPEDFKKTLHIFCNPLPKHYTGNINGFKNWQGSVLFRGKGTDWSAGMRLMLKKARELGATFYYKTPAQQILKEGNKVIGTIAKDAHGNYIKFLAKKGVLIACGDFSSNKEMVGDLLSEHFDPDRNRLEKFRGAGRSGDGHKMGLWAGGRMEPGPRAMMGGAMTGLAGAFGGTAFLRMNRNGERYTNEATWSAMSQGARQPVGSLCAVWDTNWREELEYQCPDHGNVDPSHTKNIARLTKEMNALRGTGAKGGMVRDTATIEGMPSKHYCAETLNELSDYLGYKGQAKKNFLATIERYNELAKKGVDEDYGKDPSLMHPIEKAPFYGVVSRNDGGSFALVTLAGLVIDENQKVIDDNDDPIQGLYATGNCSGGRYSLQYMTPIAGNSIGWAMTMGRIAGKYIAESS